MYKNPLKSVNVFAAAALVWFTGAVNAAGDPSKEMAVATFFYQCSGMFEATVYKEDTFCQGYLLGALHAADRQRGEACAAEFGEPMEATATLQKHLRSNLQYNSMLITKAVAQAIDDVFPCQSPASESASS